MNPRTVADKLGCNPEGTSKEIRDCLLTVRNLL